MGLIGKLVKLTTYGGVASVGAFFWTTRNDIEVPMSPSDPIFNSSQFKKLNPSKNPTINDLFVRKVPLSQIDPTLLEKKGKLVEAFSAGLWSGWGYAFQRAYLARKYQGRETADHLWSRQELRESSYPLGTLITDHFEVVEKTPDRIVVRCGDSPRVRDVRQSDGLFEMSAVIKPDEGVAEFGVKSCFFQGLGKTETVGMPPHIIWLHKQYSKLWLETAIRNVTR